MHAGEPRCSLDGHDHQHDRLYPRHLPQHPHRHPQSRRLRDGDRGHQVEAGGLGPFQSAPYRPGPHRPVLRRPRSSRLRRAGRRDRSCYPRPGSPLGEDPPRRRQALFRRVHQPLHIPGHRRRPERRRPAGHVSPPRPPLAGRLVAVANASSPAAGHPPAGHKIVAVQWASPSSNPDTPLPRSSLTLRQANCDLSVTLDYWHRHRR